MGQQIRFCTTPEGVNLAYVTFGQGSAIVVPPGWISHLELQISVPIVQAFWEKLASNHNVIKYDRHGCGLSDRDRTDFSPEKELRDLEAVIDHLKLKRFVLLGLSQAGPISVAYAVKHPKRVSHLILYGTFVRGIDTATPELKASLRSLVRASWGLGSKILSDLFVPEADKEGLEWFAKFQREAASSEMAARLLEFSDQLDVTDLLPQVSTPTLVIHRQGDEIIPARFGRDLAIAIPNANFHLVEGRDHPVYRGNSDKIVQIIEEFIGNEAASSHLPPTEKTESRQGLKRKLAAILSADVKGYSRLMEDDEEATIRTLNTYREMISTIIQKYKGRVVDSTGDNLMSEFSSIIDAVQCAVEVQNELKEKNAPLTDERKMEFRIGVNLGDVVEEGDRIYGEGVNIAARIEGLAEGGGICISGTVYDQIEGKLSLEYDHQGEQFVKNISKPVRVYKIKMRTENSPSIAKGKKKVHKIY